MTATCCPNCLWKSEIAETDIGRQADCPVCKTAFEVFAYEPKDFIKPDSEFEYPEPKSAFKLVFAFISWLYNGMQKKASPEELYIDRMIELTRDDGIFSPEDAKALEEYAFQVGLPEVNRKRLQSVGLGRLIQIFCRDGVLDDDERRALETVVKNGLVTVEDVKKFEATLQKPMLKGILQAGRLPVLPTDLLDKPKKNEILHWAGTFTQAKETKTMVKYEYPVDIMITNQRVVLQAHHLGPKSIAWEKLSQAYFYTVKLKDGTAPVLLALLKKNAKKPLLFANGDKELAIQIITGIKSGQLKMEGIQEVSNFL